MSMNDLVEGVREANMKGFEIEPIGGITGSLSEFYFKCSEGHCGEASLYEILSNPEVCIECNLMGGSEIDNNRFPQAIIRFHDYLLEANGLTPHEFEKLHDVDYIFIMDFSRRTVRHLEELANAWGMDLMEFIKRADKYNQKCKEELLND